MPAEISTTRMTCPNCHQEAEVKITRHPTASPRHVDLTCECMVCSVIWEAAESVR